MKQNLSQLRKWYTLFLALSISLAGWAVEIDGINYNLSDTEANGDAFVSQRPSGYSGSVSIPAVIFYGAFQYKVVGIGDDAFLNCTNLKEVIIPGSVTTIGSSAFSGCTGLEKVTLPESVTAIKRNAFRYCSNLAGLTIPKSVITIEQYAFGECVSLTEITIPGSAVTIKDQAFEGCTGLAKVTLLKGITTIGYGIFSHCTGLKEVTIPENVTSVGDGSFALCTGLETFYSKSSVPPSAMMTTFYSIPLSECTLYVPAGSKALYEKANIWKDFGTITETDYSGLSAPEVTNTLIYATKKGICIDSQHRIPVAIYTLPGTLLYEGWAEGVTLIPFHKGMYIVNAGETTTKVVVGNNP